MKDLSHVNSTSDFIQAIAAALMTCDEETVIALHAKTNDWILHPDERGALNNLCDATMEAINRISAFENS
jgi:hypothetical protein